MKTIRKIIAAGSATMLLGAASISAAFTAPAPAPAEESGVIQVKSQYTLEETVIRIKADIAEKGITFFTEINQQDLADGAEISLNPSVLLIFGNPPLGVQFLTASPQAGLDWPVRMLVFEDDEGTVWVAYTDFAYIGDRYDLKDRDQQLTMASHVAASITSSVTN